MLTLKVEKRTEGGKSASELRRGGSIPAVVYGAHQKAMPIVVLVREFEKILREAGEATIVSLDGLGTPLPTLIHEVVYDPINNHPEHVDFYAVTKGKKVEVEIPLSFIGESPAVEAGANLIKVLHELEVEADPMNLPHDIEVNLSVLEKIGDQIRAKDLKLPTGVTLVADPDEIVALIQEVVEEKAEEVAAPADISTIEVEKKGKLEEDAESSEAKEE